MLYNVFLVEDEIVTREGIRDSIDWAAAGYQFCGEAPDGEIALPLILESRPEVVITDIKMPFMDGLKLCRLLKSSLPETKIIILSGHDEFKYAQEAIQIGVTEYLLKPVVPRNLVAALQKIAHHITEARREVERLHSLQLQMANQRTILRERCMLNLLTATLSPADVIEQCRNLDLDLLARWYQVLVIRSVSASTNDPQTAAESLDAMIAEILGDTESIVRFKKDAEETVLILRGQDPLQLEHAAEHVQTRLRRQLETRTPYRILIGRGCPTERLGAVPESYTHALRQLEAPDQLPSDSGNVPTVQHTDLAKPNTKALAEFLRSGTALQFDACFTAYLAPLAAVDHRSRMLIDYVFTDVVLSVANFLRETGGDVEVLLQDLDYLQAQLGGIPQIDHIKDLVRDVVVRALEYRDHHAHGHSGLLAKARAYIDTYYASPDISLSTVAAHVMLSPSYFSVVFHREIGETFVEYLTHVRIRKAKELLRSTALTSSEIAYQVGYDNPRYFFAVFRKVVGQSPTAFRRLHSNTLIP